MEPHAIANALSRFRASALSRGAYEAQRDDAAALLGRVERQLAPLGTADGPSAELPPAVSAALLELHSTLARLLTNISCRMADRSAALVPLRASLADTRRHAGVLCRQLGLRALPHPDSGSAPDPVAAGSEGELPSGGGDAWDASGVCPLLATCGVRHLCRHLCYYNTYEPFRRLCLLRAAAEEYGLGGAVEGWRVERVGGRGGQIPAGKAGAPRAAGRAGSGGAGGIGRGEEEGQLGEGEVQAGAVGAVGAVRAGSGASRMAKGCGEQPSCERRPSDTDGYVTETSLSDPDGKGAGARVRRKRMHGGVDSMVDSIRSGGGEESGSSESGGSGCGGDGSRGGRKGGGRGAGGGCGGSSNDCGSGGDGSTGCCASENISCRGAAMRSEAPFTPRRVANQWVYIAPSGDQYTSVKEAIRAVGGGAPMGHDGAGEGAGAEVGEQACGRTGQEATAGDGAGGGLARLSMPVSSTHSTPRANIVASSPRKNNQSLREPQSSQGPRRVASPYFATTFPSFPAPAAAGANAARVAGTEAAAPVAGNATAVTTAVHPVVSAAVSSPSDTPAAAATLATAQSPAASPAPPRPWRPPHSPFGLIEELFWDRPWALLLCCVLLNQTRRRQVDLVLSSLLRRFPDAASLAAAAPSSMEPLLRSLGLHKQRARVVVALSAAYMAGSWDRVEELPGVGRYAADAHAIFCEGKYRETQPADHALNWYRDWLMGLDAGGGVG